MMLYNFSFVHRRLVYRVYAVYYYGVMGATATNNQKISMRYADVTTTMMMMGFGSSWIDDRRHTRNNYMRPNFCVSCHVTR
jgi:hypothetical protein